MKELPTLVEYLASINKLEDFMNNIEKHAFPVDEDNKVSLFKELKENELEVVHAFTWRDTLEGWDFWTEIENLNGKEYTTI